MTRTLQYPSARQHHTATQQASHEHHTSMAATPRALASCTHGPPITLSSPP
jgi:hypothetical protein